MKEKILDKQVLRYVIATTVSGKPTYLKKKLQKIEYSFVTNIDNATKCSSYAIAEAGNRDKHAREDAFKAIRDEFKAQFTEEELEILKELKK